MYIRRNSRRTTASTTNRLFELCTPRFTSIHTPCNMFAQVSPSTCTRAWSPCSCSASVLTCIRRFCRRCRLHVWSIVHIASTTSHQQQSLACTALSCMCSRSITSPVLRSLFLLVLPTFDLPYTPQQLRHGDHCVSLHDVAHSPPLTDNHCHHRRTHLQHDVGTPSPTTRAYSSCFKAQHPPRLFPHAHISQAYMVASTSRAA